MRSVLSFAVLWAAFVVPACAGTWETHDQMDAAMQMGSALASAIQCNVEVDTDGLATAIKDKIAPTGKLTPEMASSLMFYVVGMQATQAAISGGRMNKQQLAKHCASMLAAFGPNGSQIKGLIKP